jgi:hypothetical protein
MNNIFDYYKNPEIIEAISKETMRIKGSFDKEECKQEIFSELYDFMPMDIEEAKRLIFKIGKRYRRKLGYNYKSTSPFSDDWIPLGDGCYERKCHMHPAD